MTEEIKNWARMNSTIIIGRDLEVTKSRLLLQQTLLGILANWFEQLPEQEKVGIESATTNIEWVREYEKLLLKYFTYKEVIISEDTYKEYLAKLQICNINYFKEYACKFEEYHIKAKIDPTDKVYLSLFFYNLPAPWGSRITQKYYEIQHP